MFWELMIEVEAILKFEGAVHLRELNSKILMVGIGVISIWRAVLQSRVLKLPSNTGTILSILT